MYHFGPTEERDTIRYIDDSCSVKFGVCDFRDPVWWVNLMEATDKGGHSIKLTRQQLEEVCYRVSAYHGVMLYEDKIGMIKGDKDKIYQGLDILDIDF